MKRPSPVKTYSLVAVLIAIILLTPVAVASDQDHTSPQANAATSSTARAVPRHPSADNDEAGARENSGSSPQINKVHDAPVSDHAAHSGINWEAVVAISTVILTLATVALAAFTLKLWLSTRAMATDAQMSAAKQFNELQRSNEYANQSVLAAIDAAKALHHQSETILDDVRRTHRAWLGFTSEKKLTGLVSFESGNTRVTCRLEAKNGGGSVALSSVFINKFHILKRPSPDPRSLGYAANAPPFGPDNDFGRLILPNESIEVEANYTAKGIPCSSNDIVDVFLASCIVYRDELGVAHATTALFKFKPEDPSQKIRASDTYQGEFTILGVGSSAT